MSWTSARTAIYARALANAPVPSGRIDTSMFNGAVFSPPDLDFATPSNATWMRFQVDTVPGSAVPLGVGMSALRFRRGLITAGFFFMPETGEDEIGIVDTFIDAFDRTQFGTVTCEDADEPDVLGTTDDSGWFHVNAQIPFFVVENPDRALTVSEFLLIQSDPAAHGFAVGDVVGFNKSTGQWAKALATSAAAVDYLDSMVGLVYYVPNTNDFMVATGSTVVITGHGYGTGPLYVSQSTAGLVTTTKPTSGILWNIGTAIDGNRAAVLQRQPVPL